MPLRFTPRHRGARHYQLAAGCLLAALSCAVPLFADPTYTVFHVPGAISTVPASINLFGTITGYYIDGNWAYHGFVRDPSGTITTLDVPGSTGTGASAINIAGTIVGLWGDANQLSHSFMRDSKGTITSFDPPQCVNGSSATGINAEGAIVGICNGSNGSDSYVRNPDGSFQMFDVKGARSTGVSGINGAYIVIGSYVPTSGLQIGHGFVGWPNSTLLTTFDPPGSTNTNPMSINWVGAITGSYRDSADVYHGFVRNPLGKIVSFDPVGSKGTYANAINDAGAIAGGYSGSNDVWHGFVRDPRGVITSFDPPLGTGTEAMGINDAGVITGYFDGGILGFVRTP